MVDVSNVKNVTKTRINNIIKQKNHNTNISLNTKVIIIVYYDDEVDDDAFDDKMF